MWYCAGSVRELVGMPAGDAVEVMRVCVIVQFEEAAAEKMAMTVSVRTHVGMAGAW